jgi:hypothetical protein
MTSPIRFGVSILIGAGWTCRGTCERHVDRLGSQWISGLRGPYPLRLIFDQWN